MIWPSVGCRESVSTGRDVRLPTKAWDVNMQHLHGWDRGARGLRALRAQPCLRAMRTIDVVANGGEDADEVR